MKKDTVVIMSITKWVRPALIACVLSSLIAVTLFGQSQEPKARAMITPSLVHMELGEKQNFNAIILPSRLMAASNPKVVKWSVNAVEGGNQEVGTISKEGIYQAPRTIPKPRELHICAYTEEVQNKNLFATVIIGDGAPQYKSVHIWSKKLGSSKSDAEPKLRSPHGFGLDKEGNIMIADETGGQVLRFTVDGEFLNVIGNGPGEKPGQFKDPREVRCAPNGEIVVTDSKGDRPRMQIFNHEGDFLRIFAEKGRGPGQILRAHGIGFGPDGTMSITDVDNMRVNIYDYDSGKFLYDFGNWTPYQGMNPGEMNACHGMFVDVNGDMFVNSYYGPVHKFTPEGNIVAVFCHAEPPDGSIYFHNLTGDQWGNIYVMARPAGGAQNTEVENASAETVSVRKYNNNGDFITEWGYSDPKHRETTAAVDDNDVFYGMYVTQDTVVERFVEE